MYTAAPPAGASPAPSPVIIPPPQSLAPQSLSPLVPIDNVVSQPLAPLQPFPPLGTGPLNSPPTNPFASNSPPAPPFDNSQTPQPSNIPNPYAAGPYSPSSAASNIRALDWRSQVKAAVAYLGLRIEVPAGPLSMSQLFGFGLISVLGLAGAVNILWSLWYLLRGEVCSAIVFIGFYLFATYVAISGFYGVFIDDTHFKQSRRYERRKWLFGETFMKLVIFCVSSVIGFLVVLNYILWLLVFLYVEPQPPAGPRPNLQRQVAPGDNRFPNQPRP
jgi:hypothetical protein